MPNSALRYGIDAEVKAELTMTNGVAQSVKILSGDSVFHESVKNAMMKYRCPNVSGTEVITQAFSFVIEQTDTERAQGKVDRERDIAAAKKAQERQLWLATPEGKKYLADEAARSKKAQEDQARKDAQERVNRAKEFPLYALISCTINGQHTTIYACFGGDVDTEIELKNGSQYGLYKSYQFQSLGRETREGFAIDLRSSFQLKAQNSSESLILGVKIIDRVSNKVRFEKQVSRFGVIRIGSVK